MKPKKQFFLQAEVTYCTTTGLTLEGSVVPPSSTCLFSHCSISPLRLQDPSVRGRQAVFSHSSSGCSLLELVLLLET